MLGDLDLQYWKGQTNFSISMGQKFQLSGERKISFILTGNSSNRLQQKYNFKIVLSIPFQINVKLEKQTICHN